MALYKEKGSSGTDKRGVVPCDHPEDKKSKGFSESGIPSQEGGKPTEGLAEDMIGGKGETGPVDARR